MYQFLQARYIDNGRTTCKRLRDKYNGKILSLACRHHVLEILISAVYSCALNDKSQSPNIGLFVSFKENWKKIDANKIEFGIDHVKVKEMLSEWQIKELIDIIHEQQNAQKSNDRKDYTEFLQLSLIFLGTGSYNQKRIRISPPGALHRARFMARVIYCLKIFAFRSQINLSDNEIEGLVNFNHFVVSVYLKNWFKCVLATQAPLNDLDLVKDLHSYRQHNEAISEAGLKKMTDHLWYLGDILVGLSFFDDRHSDRTRREMLTNLQKDCKTSQNLLRNRSSTVQELCKSEIPDFISKNTMKFFNIIANDENEYDFLKKNPLTWETTPSYIKMKKTIKNLMVVNDPAERAIGLVKTVNNTVTKSTDQQNYLIQVIEDYRKSHPKTHPNTTKKTLLENLQ